MLLILVVVGVPLLVLVLVFARGGRRTKIAVSSVIGGLLLASVSLLLYVLMPFSPVGEPLLVAAATTDGGIEMLVTQTFTGTTDLYKVAFFVREGDESWSVYYLDGDALYWRGRIELDKGKKEATVYRGSTAEVRFNWEKREFRWWTGDGWEEGEPHGIVQGDPLSRTCRIRETGVNGGIRLPE